MEVHAHTHSERKRLIHYLWEFLMLFLAVFCGFLAENLREHAIEHQRELQYAHTLYEDIKVDTLNITLVIEECNYATTRIDTFRTMVQTQEINSLPTGAWYYYGRFGTRSFNIAFQDATLEQLKSSGGLRYFKKQAVVNAIAHYDQERRRFQTELSLQNFTYNDIIKARNLVFNAYYLDEIMPFDISPGKIDSFKHKTMPLLSNKREDFIQYANLCQLRSYNNRSLIESAKWLRENAMNLLVVLRKEYHLE